MQPVLISCRDKSNVRYCWIVRRYRPAFSRGGLRRAWKSSGKAFLVLMDLEPAQSWTTGRIRIFAVHSNSCCQECMEDMKQTWVHQPPDDVVPDLEMVGSQDAEIFAGNH